MDSMYGYDPSLPLDMENSMNPDLLAEVTFGTYMENSDGSIPMVAKANSGRMSPIRARTMKEYDQQLSDLKKENFSLKLRIYFMEERMQQRLGDGDDTFRTNIELKVEVENLKRDLMNRHEMLKKASMALESLVSNHAAELEEVRATAHGELQQAHAILEERCKNAEQELGNTKADRDKRNEQIQELESEIRSLEEYMEKEQERVQREQDLKDALAEKERIIDEVNAIVTSRDSQVANLQSAQEKAEKEMLDMVNRLQKQVSRKDRDVQNLSFALKSDNLDSDVLLASSHLQDAVEDQRERLTSLEAEVGDLQVETHEKDAMIGKLEDMLRDNQKECKDFENQVKQLEQTISKQEENTLKRDYAIQGLAKTIQDKTKEMTSLSSKLTDKEAENRKSHENIIRQGKEMERQYGELCNAKDTRDELRKDLRQREMEMERLAKSLGRKDGELVSLQEMLSQEKEALKHSDHAAKLVLKDDYQKMKDELKRKSDNEQIHYQTLMEDFKNQLQIKDNMLQQLTETLRDKDKQMQDFFSLMKPGLAGSPLQGKENLLKKLEERLRERDKALEESMEEKFKLLEDKDTEVRQLKLALRERDRDQERANQVMVNTEETIDTLESEAREKDKNMKQLANSLRATQKSLAEAIDNHKHAMDEKNARIKRLENSVALKEKAIEEAIMQSPQANDLRVKQLQKRLKEMELLLESSSIGGGHTSDNVLRMQRELLIMKEQLETQDTPQRMRPAGGGEEPSTQIQSLLREQLEEVKRLTDALRQEKQIFITLNQTTSGSTDDKLIFDLEMKEVQSLRQKLEDGVSRNNSLREVLERQVQHKTFQQDKAAGDESFESVTTKKHVSSLTNQLEESRRWNVTLHARLEEQQQRAGGVGESRDADELTRNSSTSPETSHRRPSQDQPDENESIGVGEIPAAHLPRVVIDLQQQLLKLQRENYNLKHQTDRVDDYRDIPGNNEDDEFVGVQSLKHQRASLEALLERKSQENEGLRSLLGFDKTTVFAECDISNVNNLHEQILKLKSQLKDSQNTITILKKQVAKANKSSSDKKAAPTFNPELILQMAKEIERLKNELDRTKTEMEAAEQNNQMSMTKADIPQKTLSSAKASQIPRRQRDATMSSISRKGFQKESVDSCDDNAVNNHAAFESDNSKNALDSQLSEAQSRIQSLEETLSHKENALEQQSAELHHYRNLFQNSGIVQSNSPTPATDVADSPRHDVKSMIADESSFGLLENLCDLSLSLSSRMLLPSAVKAYGKTNDVTELKSQVQQLKTLVQQDVTIIDALQSNSSVFVDNKSLYTDKKNGGNSHTIGDVNMESIVSEKQMDYDLNAALTQLRDQVNHLQSELHVSSAMNTMLQEKLTTRRQSQGTKQSENEKIIDSKKQEVLSLQKQLSDSQALCMQLSGRMEELEGMLGKMEPSQNGEDVVMVPVSDLKNGVDKTRNVVDLLSISLEVDALPDGPDTGVYNARLLKYRQALDEVDRLKRQRVSQCLTDELTEKDTAIRNLEAEISNLQAHLARRGFRSSSLMTDSCDVPSAPTEELDSDFARRSACDSESILSGDSTEAPTRSPPIGGSVPRPLGRQQRLLRAGSDSIESDEQMYISKQRYRKVSDQNKGSAEIVENGMQRLPRAHHESMEKMRHASTSSTGTARNDHYRTISGLDIEDDTWSSGQRSHSDHRHGISSIMNTTPPERDVSSDHRNTYLSGASVPSISGPDTWHQHHDIDMILEEDVDGSHRLSGLDESHRLSGLDASHQISCLNRTHQLSGLDGSRQISGLDGGRQIFGLDGSREISGLDGSREISGLVDSQRQKMNGDRSGIQRQKRFAEQGPDGVNSIHAAPIVTSPEVDRLRSKIQQVENLNETLRTELSLYENSRMSIGMQSSPSGRSPRDHGSGDRDMLREHLAEIRALRIRLEGTISENERLQDHLEKRMQGEKEGSVTNIHLSSMHKTELVTLRSHVQALQKKLDQRDDTIHEKIIVIKEKETIIKEIKDNIFEKEQHILQKESLLKESEQIVEKVNKKKLHLEQDLKKAVKEIKRWKHEAQTTRDQLQENKDLNRTLKLELSLFEKVQSDNLDSSSSSVPDKKGFGPEIMELLSELRHLRLQLERCIDTNNALRQKLEEQLSSPPSGGATINVKHTQSNETIIRNLAADASDGRPSPEMRNIEDRSHKITEHQIVDREKHITTRTREIANHYSINSAKVPSGHSTGTGQRTASSSQSEELNLSHGSGGSLAQLSDCKGSQRSHGSREDGGADPRCFVSAKRDSTRTAGTINVDGEHKATSSQNSSFSPLSSDKSPRKQNMFDINMSANRVFYSSRYNSLNSSSYNGDSLRYRVYDPPGFTEMTEVQVDSDLRSLFAIGKIDDFEKLKKENSECWVVLSGLEARIKDRLKVFRNVSPSKSMEYSTLKELSLASENLRLCLSEEAKVIQCFWVSQLPERPERSDSSVDSRVLAENDMLRSDLGAMRRKYDYVSKLVRTAEQRLHTSNQMKENMEDAIVKKLSKTEKVLKHARGNFEKQALKAGYDNTRFKHSINIDANDDTSC